MVGVLLVGRTGHEKKGEVFAGAVVFRLFEDLGYLYRDRDSGF